MSHDLDPIRRRADGSIDSTFYLAKGRHERSAQARRGVGALASLAVRWRAAFHAAFLAHRNATTDPRSPSSRTTHGAR